MEGETKTARIDQKSTLFYFLFFLQKIQDIRESKTSIFERGSHKNVLSQGVDHFSNKPCQEYQATKSLKFFRAKPSLRVLQIKFSSKYL